MNNEKIHVPPLKIQGIKTKIVPFIKKYIDINEDSLWIEPFMGSGVVGFNLAPENAVFCDINPHVISFYNAIKSKEITSFAAREFLEGQNLRLKEGGAEYYYLVRERFNQTHNPFDFLFLNRSCFNGMMRFNKKNDFNVPFGHKPERFAKAYITKIVNQISYVEKKIEQNNWCFLCQDFKQTLEIADKNSFIYCDPPYIGRNVDYYDSWDEQFENELSETLRKTKSKYMLSTWVENLYRKNQYIDSIWRKCDLVTTEHFYFLGGKEKNRNKITEGLLMNYTPIEEGLKNGQLQNEYTFAMA